MTITVLKRKLEKKAKNKYLKRAKNGNIDGWWQSERN